MNYVARFVSLFAIRLALALALSSAAIGPTACTAEEEHDAEEAVVDKSYLTGEIERIKADGELDDDTKQNVLGVLKSALEDLESSLEAQQRRLRLQRQLETAGRELEALRRNLAVMPEKAVWTLPQAADAEQIERRRDELERKLDQPEKGLRDRVSRYEKELAVRSERLESLGEELLESEAKLKSVRSELDELPDEDSPSISAQRLAGRVAVKRWERDVAALEVERDWLESTDAERWIAVLQEIAEREVALTESELEQVEERLEVQRRREASERVDQAVRESLAVLPALKPLANENQQLAERSRQVTERLEAVEEERSSAEERLETLNEESEEMHHLIETVGRNDAIGLMLRRQFAKLPDAQALERDIAACEDEVRELKLRQFEIDRQEQQSPDVDSLMLSVRQHAAQNSLPFEEAAAQQQAETLLDHRAELLDELTANYKRLFNQLFGLVQTDRQLMTQSLTLAAFYDQQMLWMRTSSVFGLVDLQQFRISVRTLTDEAAWQDLPAVFANDLEQRPLIYILAILALSALMLFGQRAKRAVRLGETASLMATARKAAITAIRSAVLPAVCSFAAWRLDHSDATSSWMHGVSQGLWRCAAGAWPLMFLKSACASQGLGPVHLGWSPTISLTISRHVVWFLPVSLASLLVIGATEAYGNEVISDSLGRAAFILWMGFGGCFCRAILVSAPGTGDSRAENASVHYGRRITRNLVSSIPWLVAVLAIAGYYDTALKLAGRLEATIWLALIFSSVYSAVLRWISGEEARLEAVRESLQEAEGIRNSTAAQPRSLFSRWKNNQSQRTASPAQISQQMRGLLRTAVMLAALLAAALLWKDVLPAVELFDRWPLWQTVVTQQVIEPGEQGGSTMRTVNRLEPVTVVNLGHAMLILGVTFLAARNIPGLVETVFLDRLPLDVGGRFAVTILLRYVLFIIGSVAACHQIHVGWSNVQWLVAAASVGLGFGLQDIFANFVSGIILLFERPIRVGDVITIGETTGSVSRIRFRSTTIIDADRKELVVPNKDLITGKLLNWTLSDHTNRLKIRVAVNFHSNPDYVRQLLQAIALAHPTVLKDPSPTATFEEFGANSLVFVLCAFLPSLNDRSKVLHELLSTIHARLQAEGLTPHAAAPPVAVPPTAPTGVAA